MRFVEISKPLITRVLTENLLLEAEGKNITWSNQKITFLTKVMQVLKKQ